MARLFATVDDLIAILEQPKRLINLTWTTSEISGQRGFKLKSALLSGSAALKGVSLEIGCATEGFDLPSRVVLMAEIDNKTRAIARVDINGSLHPNSRAVCGDLQHIDAGRTHFHDTRLHRKLTIDQLFHDTRWDLPVAQPISNMPKEFSRAMEKSGELLHIINLGEVEEPQWQPKQFLF